jgi:mycothiol synthase
VTTPPLVTTGPLTAAQADLVRDLQARAAEADGVAALGEQSLLDLEGNTSRAVHLLGYAGERLVGYAQAAPGEGPDAVSAEMVVHPAHRRGGVGATLAGALLERHPGVRVWAHGDLPAARALARSCAMTPVRSLHKMSRPLGSSQDETSAAALPAGFRARAFEPGRDEAAWLEANAAAFASHPEQGRLGLGDLRERMSQDWFDPAGFLLVEADEDPGTVAAFHWTKTDPRQRSTLDPSATAGEVYVLGVHPAYQGRGLARPVTALGLAHLAARGLPEVVLYVDGDNAAALRTYTGLGFRSIMVDVMYARTQPGGLSG